jgi:hypothetical protein
MLRPYPHSPPVNGDLHFRRGRLKLAISGDGPIQFAEVNGRRAEPHRDGVLQLPAEFDGGLVILHTPARRRTRSDGAP